MKFFVKKTLSGLIPIDRSEFDKLQSAKLKLGEVYEVVITKKRNYEFHKKLFALLNICYENQENFENLEDLRTYIIMRAGFYKRIETPTGEFYRPKSISFSKMDAIEFQDLYDKVLIQVIKFIGVDREDLINKLSEF